MASNTGFSFANAPARPNTPAFGISQGGTPHTPNPPNQAGAFKSVFGGHVNNSGGASGYPLSPALGTPLSSTTPTGPPPTFPSLFGQQKTAAGGLFGLPSSSSSSVSSSNPFRNNQKSSGSPFTSTVPAAGSVFGSQAKSTFGNNGTSMAQPAGLVSSASNPFSNGVTAVEPPTVDTGNMFNAAVKASNAGTPNSTSPAGGLSGTPATTNVTSPFGSSQTVTGNNALSLFAPYQGKTGNAAPATSVFAAGSSAKSFFAPAQAQTSVPTSILAPAAHTGSSVLAAVTPPATSPFTPAQASSTSNIGNQLAQLAAIAANRPAVGLFGTSTTSGGLPISSQMTTINNPLSTAPTGLSLLAPPATLTPVFPSALIKPLTFAPPTAAPPAASIFALVAPASTTPLFPSTGASSLASVVPTVPSIPARLTIVPPSASIFAPTPPTAPAAPPATSIFAPTAPPAATSIFIPAPPTQAQSNSQSPDLQTQAPLLQITKAPQEPRLANNRSLEEIITRWSIDLETYKVDFIERGSEIKKWENIMAEHTDKILNLSTEVIEAERTQGIVDNMLNQLENEQEHLEKLFDYYEASLGEIENQRSEPQPVDDEREIVFNAVLTLNDKLVELGAGAEEMIKALNDASAKLENTTNTDDSLSSILKILNNHLSIMQWVDTQTTSLAEKIKNAKIPRPIDTEDDITMRRYHNEHMSLRR